METRLRTLLPGGRFGEVSPERSRVMQAVRGRGNRTTEKRLRFALVRAKVRGWTLGSNLPGRPDFFFPDACVVVFVDGCFWHGCPKCGHVPKTNADFWAAKIQRNRDRDRATSEQLAQDGYQVLRFWEHELREDLAACVERIRKTLAGLSALTV